MYSSVAPSNIVRRKSVKLAVRLLRSSLAVSILLAQVAAIFYARFVPSRYFCWAPFDMQTDYQIEAQINGEHLTPSQIRSRYRRPQKGTDNRSVQHIIDIIQQAEHRYHANDNSEVLLRYSVNGKELKTWKFERH